MNRERVIWLSVSRPMLATLLTAALPVVGVVIVGANGVAIESQLSQWSLGWAGVVVVIGGTVLAGLALLPTHAVSLAMGWLFGPFWGSVLAMLTVTAAAWLGYQTGRLLAGTGLAEALPADSRIGRLHLALVDGASNRTTLLVALLRLSPAAPFAATNVALAAVAVPQRPFLVGSLIGLAPRLVAVVLLGAGMQQLDFERPGSTVLLVAGIIATLAIIVIFGQIARRIWRMTADAATVAA